MPRREGNAFRPSTAACPAGMSLLSSYLHRRIPATALWQLGDRVTSIAGDLRMAVHLPQAGHLGARRRRSAINSSSSRSSMGTNAPAEIDLAEEQAVEKLETVMCGVWPELR